MLENATSKAVVKVLTEAMSIICFAPRTRARKATPCSACICI